MIITISKYISIFFLFAFAYTTCIAQQDGDIKVKLEKAIGGQDKWTQTHYILFTVSGNDLNTNLNGSRTFLINKSNGDVRFEGENKDRKEVVHLFNYKSHESKDLFIDNKKIKKDSLLFKSLHKSIANQFYEDTKLLFTAALLPESLSADNNNYQQKIVNAEKVVYIHTNRLFSLQSQLTHCDAIVNVENGKIRKLDLNGSGVFMVSGYKDIGGGLILPTQFDNIKNRSQSCIFSTVASFTEIEDSKFDSL